MNEPNKPKKRKIGWTKLSNVDLEYIYSEIKQMLVNFKPMDVILQHIQTKYNRSNSQARKYIRLVRKEYFASKEVDLEETRNINLEFLVSRIRTMLDLFESSGDAGYERLAQGWYDKYVKLFPNELKPIIEESDKVIKVSFDRLEDKE